MSHCDTHRISESQYYRLQLSLFQQTFTDFTDATMTDPPFRNSSIHNDDQFNKDQSTFVDEPTAVESSPTEPVASESVNDSQTTCPPPPTTTGLGRWADEYDEDEDELEDEQPPSSLVSSGRTIDEADMFEMNRNRSHGAKRGDQKIVNTNYFIKR